MTTQKPAELTDQTKLGLFRWAQDFHKYKKPKYNRLQILFHITYATDQSIFDFSI